MNGSCLHFLNRRYLPSSDFLTDPTRSKNFQNSFVKSCPRNRTSLKNFQTNLLIPYKVKSPTRLQEQICFFPITLCTNRQRPKKYRSQETSLKYSNQRLSRNPDRNHMTPYSLNSCRRIDNTVSPETCSPTNKCITLNISPKNTSNSQQNQRNSHSQRDTRNPNFKFTCIIRCIEYCNQNSKTVSTCQTSNSHLNQMTISCWSSRSCPGLFQNSIFTIISSQERPSLKTQTSQKQTSPSLRQGSMCSTRTTHVLNVSTRMNNNTSSLELQCFKTSVCHLVIHSQSIMTLRKSHHHVSLLTTSTICNHTFYIILNQPYSPPHQTCNSTNPLQKSTRIDTAFPNPICTCNLKNSSSNLSCSMDLCRYRSRSFHPISQPDMLSHLSTLSKSTSQEGQTNPICIICRSPCCSQQRGICTSQIPPTLKQTYKQNSITYTIHLHCFLCRFCPTLSMKPKSNQLITTYTNHFPTNHQSLQIICCYQLEHRTCKQALITLKTGQMRIILHISLTIDMNTETYCTNSHHHRRTLRIKRQEPIYSNCMCTKPTSICSTLRNNYSRSKRPDFIKNQITQKSTRSKTKYGHTSTTTSTKPTTSLTSLGTSQKRRKNSTQIHFLFYTRRKNKSALFFSSF